MRTRRKFLSLLMALGLLLSLVPAAAAAEVAYTDWTGETGLPTQGVYRLTTDVTLSSKVTVGSWASTPPETPTKTLVLDLNGHTVTAESGAAFFIQTDGGLTIEDSAGGGKITNGGASSGYLIQANGGDFTLSGGTLENAGSGGYALFVNSGSNAIISGGKVLNTASNGYALQINGSNVDCTVNGGTIQNTVNGGEAVYVNGGYFTLDGGTVIQGSTYRSDAAINANNGAAAIQIVSGKVESNAMGVYAAFTPVTVSGGEIKTEGHAFQTRNTTIEPASGQTVSVTSGQSVFYAFSESNNAIHGGDFTAQALSSEYTSEKESALTITDGTFVVEEVQKPSSTNTKTTISGGSYAVPVDPEYLDESLKYELHSTETNSDAPYSYYPSTEEALQNAKPGDTISDVTQEPSAETYTVTLQYRDGVTADTVYADQPAGHLLVLPSPTRAGYTFLGWYDGSQTVSSPYPVSATVTLTAQWKEDAKPDDGKDDDSSSSSDGDNSYTISIPSKTTGGTVTVSPRYAEKGDSVTLTVKPDEGYILETLTVTDTNGNTMKLEKQSGSRYTFTMPDMRVTVQASFAADSAAASPVFSDVPNGYWAEDAILWAYENGYMNGNTASTFNPGGTVTRQQLWMILARLNGQSPADFAAARDWAVESGLSDGTAPGSPVSRQQLVTMLWRQAGRPAATAALTSYPDAASVADYAVGALSWAVENGFVSGTASGTLNPGGTATRAQFAVILQRYCTAAQ